MSDLTIEPVGAEVVPSIESPVATEQVSKKPRRKKGSARLLTNRKRVSKKRSYSDTEGGGADSSAKRPRVASAEETIENYRTRISQLGPEAFSLLQNKYLSIYDAAIKGTVLSDGEFPVPWTRVLADVAAEKGVTIRGLLHHQHRQSANEPPIFSVRPDVVIEADRHLYGGQVIADRVYLASHSPKVLKELRQLAVKKGDAIVLE